MRFMAQVDANDSRICHGILQALMADCCAAFQLARVLRMALPRYGASASTSDNGLVIYTCSTKANALPTDHIGYWHIQQELSA